MRTNELDVGGTEAIGHGNDQPVVIPLDVEDHAATLENARAAELFLYLCRVFPISLLDDCCNQLGYIGFNNGDPIDRRGRLCALRSAMCVLGQQKTLLVLDEIEDLFSGSSELAMLAVQERQKGWINRMLEENPIPCFWLTNCCR